MRGKGTDHAKIATKAAAAINHSDACFSVREPMRHAACSTSATTAGFTPYSTPATIATSPYAM